MAKTLVELQEDVMQKNDELADRMRRRFKASGTFVINVLSSPGSGKTTLLQETLRRLGSRLRVAALVGDQATDNDAQRLKQAGVPVRQISTGAECRLDAQMIDTALEGWDASAFDVLCIENVGNLICPAEYDLGEDLRVAVFSVTEGEDKPLKYPLAFNTSRAVVISKVDIADAVGFDAAAARSSVRKVNPDVPIIELSAKTGAGMDGWVAFLDERIKEKQAAPAAR